MDEKTRREYLLKETEIVQSIIARMANNSFLIKGWSLTLVIVSLLLEGVFYHHYLALIPWIIFWLYDAYFLRLERLYRQLYDWLTENRLNSDDYILDVSKDSLERRFGSKVNCQFQVMFSKILTIFYGFLLVMILSVIYLDSCIKLPVS